MKILSILTFIAMISMALAGCGGNTESKTLSEDEYKAEVKRIDDEITVIYNNYITNLTNRDSTDKRAFLDIMNKLSEKLKSLYQEISDLQAPEAFADDQSKIKAAAEAYIEFLDFSMEILKLYYKGNLSKEEAENKNQELDAKEADLAPKYLDYLIAIEEITK